MMTLTRLIASILAITAGFSLDLSGQNWPQWRGPSHNGSTDIRGLPANLIKGDATWALPLPGKAGSTPVVWGDRIFLTTPDAAKNLLLLCVDRTTGGILWQQQVAVGDKEIERNNMAAPSPVTDGNMVYALFGTSDIAAFDFTGKLRWSRNLGRDFGKFSVMWIYGSSPLLVSGQLIVQVFQRDDPSNYSHALDNRPHRESYLLALDSRTGKDVWRHLRKTDSTKESQESYATPVPWEGAHGAGFVVVGGDHVSTHRLRDGSEVWRARLYEKRDDWYRIVTSPVVSGGLVYASGPKGQPVVAFKDGGEGNVTQSHRAWEFTDAPTDWSTPLLMGGKLFVLDGNKKIVSCLDPSTGARKWSGRLDTDTLWTSPSGGDGKIYVVSEKGSVVVLSAGDEFKVLSRLDLDEGPVRSSVALARGQVFVRTAKNLYCFGSGH